MSWIRSIALLLSATIHAALLLFFVSRSGLVGLDDGKGRDDLTLAIPISIENSDLVGLSERDVQASDAAAPSTRPGRERQEPEKQSPNPVEARTANPDKLPQQAAVEERPADQPKRPAEDVPSPLGSQTPQPPPQVQQEQEQAGHALEARRMQLSSSYQRDILKSLNRHSVNPNSGHTGRVVILATIAPSGKLVARKVTESSGSDILDKAALATVDKSAPFPPIPRELGSDVMMLPMPFEYSTR